MSSDETQDKVLEELRRIREAVEPKPAAAPPPPKGFGEEFRAFLEKRGVIGLALAVIVGGAASKLVTAMVNDLLMPILTFFIPEGGWREAALMVGPIRLAVGDFLGALLDFIIISFVVFMIMRQLEKK